MARLETPAPPMWRALLSGCSDTYVYGGPRFLRKFTEEALCRLKWVMFVAIPVWLITAVIYQTAALYTFLPSADVAPSIPPQTTAAVLAAVPILMSIAASLFVLIRMRGGLTLSAVQWLCFASIAVVISAQAAPFGFSHGDPSHLPTLTFATFLVLAVTPSTLPHQVLLTMTAVLAPLCTAILTGYSSSDLITLLTLLNLPFAAGLIGTALYYSQLSTFRRHRLTSLSLARRNKEIARQQRKLEHARNMEQIRIEWLERIGHFLQHETRNALAGANTSLELLQRRSNIPHTDKHLRQAQSSVQYISFLLQSVSEATSIETTFMTERPEQVQLRPLLEQNLDRYQNLYPDRRFVFASDNSHPIVIARPERVTQVLDNILSNAVEHSFANALIELSFSANESSVRIEVKNEGDSLPEDISQDELFDLFVSYTASGYRDWRGIGLYVVKLIVEHYGGTVSARSRCDKSGAHVKVTFPLVTASCGPQGASSSGIRNYVQF